MFACDKYKTAQFECAKAGCPNMISGSVIYNASEFLDDGYEDQFRRIKGVVINPNLYQQKPQAMEMHVHSDDTGALVCEEQSVPLTEQERHEYFCESCTKNMHNHKLWDKNTQERYLEQFRRHHKDKHIVVPHSDREQSLLNGSQLEIRVLGPGLALTSGWKEFRAMELKMDLSMYTRAPNPRMPKHVRQDSVLPVKLYGENALDTTGIEIENDYATYSTLLGVFNDGQPVGRCELRVCPSQIANQHREIIDVMLIRHLYIDEQFRERGIGHAVLSYAVRFARRLNEEFGTHTDKLVMRTSTSNATMNRLARSCGFVCQWDGNANGSGYTWTYSLRQSLFQACQTNKDTRFLQHLELPTHVKTRRDMRFAFVYSFQNELHTATHAIKIPCPTWNCSDDISDAIYKIYDFIESTNKYPAHAEWFEQQARFYQSLSNDEHLSLLTYAYHGDEIINEYMQYSTINCGKNKRTPSWYYYAIDSYNYVLFQPQICRIHPDLFIPDDCKRIGGHIPNGKCTCSNFPNMKNITIAISKWKSEKWKPVLEVYMEDMRVLFAKAPRLRFPITTYRGEKQDYKFPHLRQSSARNCKRIISTSLDASVAAFFSHSHKNDEEMYLPPGTIYKIVWPVGSQLIVTLGSNPNHDIMESEVRAFQPLFHVPQDAPSDEKICVPYMRDNTDTGKKDRASVTYNIVCMQAMLRPEPVLCAAVQT
jgi:GNAT superfamily N-acetyltransferase